VSRLLSRRAFLRCAGLTAAVLSARGVDAAAIAPGDVLVEDWTTQPLGAHGIPAGWQAYETPGGHPAYDFTAVEDEGRHALLLKSVDDHSTIARRISVDLAATPMLEWEWKVIELPKGADLRRKATSDVTGHVFVAWPRPPALLRTRLIGYVWDATLPPETIVKSAKTGAVHFVVVRTGTSELGRWHRERRDVQADYRRIHGEDAPNPQIAALSIDTNDTRAPAAALIGTIAFTRRPPAPS
jgi:DUF3047 family protein